MVYDPSLRSCPLMISQAISRYLDHYAEPIARMIQAEWLSTLDQIYQSVLVLPLLMKPSTA